MTPKRRAPARASPQDHGSNLCDEKLVTRAQKGDRRSFDLLVLRYMERIYNLCRSKLGSPEDALDATQETFLKAYKALARFEGKSRFYTWLFRIAINCAFTFRKRRFHESQMASLDHLPLDGNGEPFDPPDYREDPRGHLLRKEEVEKVKEAIRALPESFQEIVLLRDIEGMTYEEIAEILSLPIGSVKSRLHRARLHLRELLRPLFDDLAVKREEAAAMDGSGSEESPVAEDPVAAEPRRGASP